MKRLLAVLLLLLPGVALANYDGISEYTYSGNGLYAHTATGVLYTREWVAPVYSYRYGYRYIIVPGYYLYTRHSAPATTTVNNYTVTPPNYSKDWRDQFTKFLERREDYATYLKALNAAGYVATDYAVGNVTVGRTFGVAGNTTYGYPVTGVASYGVNQATASYGTTDLNVLYQQSSRLADRLIQSSGDATRGHMDLVALAGDNAARIAEFSAKARLVESLGRASNIAPSTKTTVTTTSGTAAATIPPPMPPADGPATNPAAAAAVEFLRTVGTPRCAACHSGATAKGGFQIGLFPSMSDDEREKVYARLYSADPKKVMPPPDSSKMTAAEKKAFHDVPGVSK